MNESNSPTRTGGDKNLDPITGEPGSHPVGTGVGSASGAAAGAALGAIGGPVGAVIGGAIGAVAGGLAGHGVAESIDPTAEDAYWRSNYKTRDYASGSDASYEDYQPAYRTGYTGYATHGTAGKTFDQAEGDLKNDWENTKGDTKIGWEKAKMATRDAWHKVANTASNATDKVSDSVTGGDTADPGLPEAKSLDVETARGKSPRAVLFAEPTAPPPCKTRYDDPHDQRPSSCHFWRRKSLRCLSS